MDTTKTAPASWRLGIDLGGTKIEAVVLGDDGSVQLRQRIATPRAAYADVIGAVAQLARGMEAQVGRAVSVGVGIPGSLVPGSDRVRNANLQLLNGQRLAADLAAALARPVRVANDANCFTLSEAVDGAGAGKAGVFGVILGTGCGGGVAMHGALWEGRSRLAGEWGHNSLPWPDAAAGEVPGPPCYCGRSGCIEPYVSGTGLARDYALVTGDSGAAGTGVTAKEIVSMAAGGDTGARAALQRLERRLAKALAAVINVLDPDVIVLGGGLSLYPALYESVPALWSEYVFGASCQTELRPAVHGDASGVRGAAWLWPADGVV